MHSDLSCTHPTIPHSQLSVTLRSNIDALLAALQHLARISIPHNDWEALQDYHNLCKDLSPLFTDLQHVNEFVGLQLEAHFTNEPTESAERDLVNHWIHDAAQATAAAGTRADARVRQRMENEDGYIVVDVLSQPRGDPPSHSRWWHFR